MNMAELVEAYLARQRSLGMRFDFAERLLHRFCRALGNPEIGKVTPELVATFLRGQGALSATWLLRYRVLTGLYRFAISRGVCRQFTIADDFAKAAAPTNPLRLFHRRLVGC